MKGGRQIQFFASVTGRYRNDRVSQRNESNIFKYPKDVEFVSVEIGEVIFRSSET